MPLDRPDLEAEMKLGQVKQNVVFGAVSDLLDRIQLNQQKQDAASVVEKLSAVRDEEREYRRTVLDKRLGDAENAYIEGKLFFEDVEMRYGGQLANDNQRLMFTEKLASIKDSSLDVYANHESTQRRLRVERAAQMSQENAINSVRESPLVENVQLQVSRFKDDLDSLYPEGRRDDKRPDVPGANEVAARQMEIQLHGEALQSAAINAPQLVAPHIAWLRTNRPGLIPDKALAGALDKAEQRQDQVTEAEISGEANRFMSDPEAALRYIDTQAAIRIAPGRDDDASKTRRIRVAEAAKSDFKATYSFQRTIANERKQLAENAEGAKIYNMIESGAPGTAQYIRSNTAIDWRAKASFLNMLEERGKGSESDPATVGRLLAEIEINPKEFDPVRIEQAVGITVRDRSKLKNHYAESYARQTVFDSVKGPQERQREIDGEYKQAVARLYNDLAKAGEHNLSDGSAMSLYASFTEFLNSEKGRGLHGPEIMDAAKKYVQDEWLPQYSPYWFGAFSDKPVMRYQIESGINLPEGGIPRAQFESAVSKLPDNTRQLIEQKLRDAKIAITPESIWTFYQDNKARIDAR